MRTFINFACHLVTTIVALCIQYCFSNSPTTAQAAFIASLCGLLQGVIAGYLLSDRETPEHIAARASLIRAEADRIKNEEESKQHQWERDRTEPTDAEKEARLRAIVNANEKLAFYHGHPVIKADKTRICTHCLSQFNEINQLEHINYLGNYYRCPTCNRKEHFD